MASARHPPPRKWVTLYAGSLGRVTVLEGILQAEGIPSFVPDRQTKFLDPFITGGNALDLELQVPSDQLPVAREIVARAFPAPEALAASRVRWRWLLFAALLGLPTVVFFLLDAF